ncbi:MAG: hypothetical protein HC906_06315 [Bacteroidales bacterium]|nr:hypothetical protein [Bacteroidales bacterium]
MIKPKNYSMRLELYGKGNLNFVEFNFTGDNDAYKSCDDESHYMDTEVFNLFTHCFERSCKLFDYFGPTRYNSRNIVPLLNELTSNLEKIKEINSLDFFIDFVGNCFLGTNFIYEIEKHDKSWNLNWEQYNRRLADINTGLINLVTKCIEDSRTLWVIGY